MEGNWFYTFFAPVLIFDVVNLLRKRSGYRPDLENFDTGKLNVVSTRFV